MWTLPKPCGHPNCWVYILYYTCIGIVAHFLVLYSWGRGLPLYYIYVHQHPINTTTIVLQTIPLHTPMATSTIVHPRQPLFHTLLPPRAHPASTPHRTREETLEQGCQNRDSVIRFYEFTIQTYQSDSTILVHKIYVSTILVVKILRFAILPSELRSDSKSRFWQPCLVAHKLQKVLCLNRFTRT